MKLTKFVLLTGIVLAGYLNNYGFDIKALTTDAFGVDSVLSYSGDSLVLGVCSEFSIFPFGEIRNKNEIKNSLLGKFSVIKKIDTLDNQVVEFQDLNFMNSNVCLYFGDSSDLESVSDKMSYIVNGVINDKEVTLDNEICIGMMYSQFVKKIFKSSPKEFKSNYNTVIIYSCIDPSKQIYTFKNMKLVQIRFQNELYDYLKSESE